MTSHKLKYMGKGILVDSENEYKAGYVMSN